MGHSITYL